ncbi:hypothetical protein ACFOHM_11125, partial [Microbaculum marinum]
WRSLAPLASRIGPLLKPGTLVVEVCSIKMKPLAVLAGCLPGSVDIVGTHPLFGPQSGRHGIAGLNVVVCTPPGRPGPRAERAARRVAGLLRSLGLSVIRTGADEHDRQMAYVQGLTHAIARAIAALEVPPLDMTTATWRHLMRMADMVGGDSDDLFRTITRDNPHAAAVRERFAAALAGRCAPGGGLHAASGRSAAAERQP